jgi:hypothetical protein
VSDLRARDVMFKRVDLTGARRVLTSRPANGAPRNVLVELPDGRLVVVPGQRWRFAKGKRL